MLGIMKRIAGSYGQVRPEMAAGLSGEDRSRILPLCLDLSPAAAAEPRWTIFEGLRADQSLICFTDRTQANDYLKIIALKQNRASVH